MNKEKSIDVLNVLVEINNDRIAGYETASKETEESDLKSMFTEFINTSKKCNRELSDEVRKLGGTPEEGTKTTGKIYRVWMDTKAALTGKDRKAILNSCEYGEDIAVGTYKKVLDNDTDKLTAEQRTMITAQFNLIKAGHDKVKYMRDRSVSQS